MGEHKRPVDQVLDLFVYAPLGLALAARDEFPHLIERGRTQVSGQIALAKMIGQFAVTQGQQELKKRADQVLGQVANPRRPSAPAAPTPGAREPARAPAPSSNGHDADATVAASAAPSAVPVSSEADAAAQRSGPPPSESDDHLAIPGYDTLSASQVVQRLAGLAPAELEAVRRHEAATRARRTILAKVAQLQSGTVPGQ